MKFTFYLTSIISIFLLGCGNNQNEDHAEKSSKNEIPKKTNEEILEREGYRLKGGGSVKSIENVDSTAVVAYVKNYEEYKKLNPNSLMTESDLKSYWESGDAIEKALVSGSVKLMKKLDFINAVEITLPFENDVYYISISEQELEEFIGKDFNNISQNMEATFINPFVYDDSGRRKFFSKFGGKR